jgi:site-specific DNA-adenine methylase
LRLASARPVVKVEVLNDVNSDLVNLYRVVKHHLDEFCRQFRWALTSREMYKWLQGTPADCPRFNAVWHKTSAKCFANQCQMRRAVTPSIKSIGFMKSLLMVY